jgi:hypothetical protein
MTDKTQSSQVETEPHNDEPISPERREAMKKLGKYGAYTAPAVITLLASRKVPAQSAVPTTTSSE